MKEQTYRYDKLQNVTKQNPLADILKSVGILLVSTALCLLFDRIGFTDANIIMVYILGVLLISLMTSRRS